MTQRPWLLRKLRSKRYIQSRESCSEAAIADFKIVGYLSLLARDADPGSDKRLRGTAQISSRRYWVDHSENLSVKFIAEVLVNNDAQNVAMIAGISIIIDPVRPFLSLLWSLTDDLALVKCERHAGNSRLIHEDVSA